MAPPSGESELLPIITGVLLRRWLPAVAGVLPSGGVFDIAHRGRALKQSRRLSYQRHRLRPRDRPSGGALEEAEAFEDSDGNWVQLVRSPG